MFEKYKKIFAAIGSMLLIVGVFSFSTQSGPEASFEVEVDPSAFEVSQVVVHVDGAVVQPGVYELDQGARIEDAINSAGGLLEDANAELINYAALIEDGQKITVLKKKPQVNVNINNDETVSEDQISNQAIPIYERTDYTILEKINYMTAEDFQAVPGIGEKISDEVIAYREGVGQFVDVGELVNVPGIGEGKKEKIVEFLSN